ncbi:SDR family oxidoreductase [Streptomyces sp. AC558_RSS880]|uniref:SDR family oxidoreductase n=1 Tax=Streptomyces sp. AC558_RSS880 TaxID=2823687 RepID=UPI001C248FBB|nr:SDR family oxidoreductase [Streptomyces sp. AC558_RSS880]
MQGKAVFVSIAARGQGAAQARRMAAEGAAYLLTEILDATGKETAAGIAEAGGADFLHLNVRENDDWEAVDCALTV